MNTFVNSLRTPRQSMTRTDNGALTPATTNSSCLDLFFHIGGLRSNPAEAVRKFRLAYAENADLASRIVLHARDVRQGSGERNIYREVVQYLNKVDPERAERMTVRMPELGRWDDVLESSNGYLIADMLRRGLTDANTRQLVAKWLPREKSAKRSEARRVMSLLGLTPREYRKLLADTSSTVEQLMCSRRWTDIELEKVPSLAQSRYRNAFEKHLGLTYKKTVAKMASGEVKVNAGALYPYDVVKQLRSGGHTASRDLANAQWAALPNWMPEEGAILPIVDTSGSMGFNAFKDVSMGEIARSIGLYVANKQRGPFKNLALTFSSRPRWIHFDGSDVLADMSKYPGIVDNTNLQAAFDLILSHAQENRVSPNDMPKFLLVISDMQFDACVSGGTNFDAVRRKFSAAGYELPNIVFWNLAGRTDNQTPVTSHQSGAALVSGFSPAVAKSVLKMDLEDMSPYKAMLDTVGVSRYDH